MRSQIRDDAQLIEIWLQNYARNTARSYIIDVAEFIDYIATELRDVQTEAIREYMATVKVPSDVVRRRKLVAIKSLYRFGMELGYLQSDPAAIVRNVRPAPDHNPKALTENDILALLRAANDDREFIILGFAYYTALSSNEMIALTWGDLRASEVHVTVAPHRRVIAIPPHFLQRITRYGNSVNDRSVNQPIFPSRIRGGFLTARQIGRIIDCVGDRAGITDVNISMIRNAHAQHALAHGVSLEDVQMTMRHRTTRTTVRHQKHE
jgi:integrase/recombinase XerD